MFVNDLHEELFEVLIEECVVDIVTVLGLLDIEAQSQKELGYCDCLAVFGEFGETFVSLDASFLELLDDVLIVEKEVISYLVRFLFVE